MFLEACGNGSEMLELVEETLDEVPEAIQESTEGRDVDASGHRFDVGPCPAFGGATTQGIAVVGTIAEQSLAFAQSVEHIAGALSVVSLAFADLQGDRIAIAIDQNCGATSSATRW